MEDVERAAAGGNNVQHFQNEEQGPSRSGALGGLGGLSAPPEAARQAPQPESSQVPEQQQQKKSGAKSKKDINPDFKEVQETGSWGKMSRSEFHVVMGVVAMVVIAVVVLVVLVLTHVIGHKDETPPAPTLSPVVVFNERQQMLRTVLKAVRSSNVSDLKLEELPNSVAYYEDKADGAAGIGAQGMSWLLYSDTYNHDSDFVDTVRYALATLYYAWSGPNWYNSSKWLTSTSFCEWNGITCDIQGNVTAFELNSNNLVGKIPPELALVTSLVALNMANNQLSGPLPGSTLGVLPQLGIINFQNNSLTGTIPDNLRSNDYATTLTLFLNNFTGDFPYCAFYQDNETSFFYPLLKEFQIDCITVNCTCCDPHTNCFDSSTV